MSSVGVGKVVRGTFAGATIAFAAIGFLIGNDPRWFVASGATGLIWTLWGWAYDHLLQPFANWLAHAGAGNVGVIRSGDLRPTLEDTIRLLESHLERGASRQVQIQAAIRLEEIYRTIKKDPARAAEVMARVRARFPDAAELRKGRED